MLDGRYVGKDGPCRWVGRASRQLAEVFCSNWVDYWLRKRAPPPGPWPLSIVEHVVTSWWRCAGRLWNLQERKTNWRKCYWGWALPSSAMTTACGFSSLALHNGLAFLNAGSRLYHLFWLQTMFLPCKFQQLVKCFSWPWPLSQPLPPGPLLPPLPAIAATFATIVGITVTATAVAVATDLQWLLSLHDSRLCCSLRLFVAPLFLGLCY